MSHNWVTRITVLQCETPSQRTSSQTPFASRRQDDRRRPHRTHRVGALPQSHLGLCGTLVGPGKDTHGTPVPLRKGSRGWPKTRFTRNTETTRPRLQRHTLVTNIFGGLFFYALVMNVSFFVLSLRRSSPGCLLLVRFETRDGAMYEAVLSVFARFECTTAPKTWRFRLSQFASQLMKAPSTWGSSIFFFSARFVTHEGAKNVVVQAVFPSVRFGTRDDAMYVRSRLSFSCTPRDGAIHEAVQAKILSVSCSVKSVLRQSPRAFSVQKHTTAPRTWRSWLSFIRFGTHDGAKHVRSSCWLLLSRLASSGGGPRLGFFVLPVRAPVLLGVT